MKKCGLLLLCMFAVVNLVFSQNVKITGVVISAEDKIGRASCRERV